MNYFTIKDIENLSGIKAHTIRIWEQRYSLLKPKRTDTNIRYYNNEQLRLVLNIALLNRSGFKISKISSMTTDDIEQQILALDNIDAQKDRLVNTLIQRMITLDMEGFEVMLDKYIAGRGIEAAIIQIIFPFLERIGILWQTGHINPAQEHLVSNIIRQKIIVGIDKVRPKISINKTFLLFLPEGEYHEMGLLFVCYLLKSRGINVIYIGANIPLSDVLDVTQQKKPDYIYIHLTSTAASFNFDRFITNLTKKVGRIPLIMSGSITRLNKKKLPAHITIKRSLSEVMEMIASLDK